jgi:hypothetical protein
MQIENRAFTPEEKKVILDDLLEAWLKVPELRLGQLLECAKPKGLDDIFYIEDKTLIKNIQKFIKDNGK